MCLKNVLYEWSLNYCYNVQFESILVSFVCSILMRLFTICIYANLMWYLLCCKVIMYQLYPKRWSKNDHPLWAGKFSHHHAFHYSLMLYASSKDSTRLVFSHDWTKKRHNLASFIFFSFYQLLLPSVADSPSRALGSKNGRW